MSWWVYLEDRTASPWCSYGVPAEAFVPDYPGDEPCPQPCYPAVPVARFTEGGTHAMGGSDEAALNVTYNYGVLFAVALGGLGFREALDGKRASELIALLSNAVQRLGTNRSADYWASTAGNAGAVLAQLHDWAVQHPNAVFRVS